jgi:long-subunit fatty acid transport protein
MRISTLALALSTALAASPLFAITSDEVNAGIQFNFANPGARALGMGGAFLGLADDATAAYTNPAGLTILGASEIALEYRNTDYSTPFASGGSFRSSPFDNGNLGVADADSNNGAIAYFSYTYAGDGWALAAYRHQPLGFDVAYTQQPIAILNAAGQQISSLPLKTTRLDTELVNYGLSGAYKFSDSFSLGIGVVYSQFEIDSRTAREGRNFQLQQGDDNDISFNIGALWKLNERWALGAAYRRGGNFEYTAGNFNAAGQPLIVTDTAFDVPHVLGVGLSWRPSDNFALALDVNRVEYSRLANGYDDIFGAATVLDIEDGTEIRLGGEYVFSQFANPFSVRAGIWREPEHALFATGPQNDLSVDIDRALFLRGDDELHYSLGLGWAFSQWQFDLAADFSDNVDTYSASGVLRF